MQTNLPNQIAHKNSHLVFTPKQIQYLQALLPKGYTLLKCNQQKNKSKEKKNNKKKQELHFSVKKGDGYGQNNIDERKLQQIIRILKQNEQSIPFLYPVDPEELQVYDYFDIIEYPMDLQTVENKLRSLEYETEQDFYNDLNLIWKNAQIYNEAGSQVHQMAVEMESHAKSLENMSRQQLFQYRQKIPQKKQLPQVQPLTYNESAQLIQDIKLLNENHIMEIYQKVQPFLGESQNIEFSLDKIPPRIARDLLKFVKSKLPTQQLKSLLNQQKEQKYKEEENKIMQIAQQYKANETQNLNKDRPIVNNNPYKVPKAISNDSDESSLISDLESDQLIQQFQFNYLRFQLIMQQSKLSTSQRIDLNLSDFDPFAYPPDLEEAKFHAQCHQFGLNQSDINQETRHCPCCFLIPVKKRFKTFKDSTNILSQVNPVISIYFKFLKYAGLILLINFIVSGLITLYDFPQIRKCIIENCEFSIEEMRETYEDKNMFRILVIINTILIFLIKMAFKKNLKKVELKMEINHNRISDYTLLIKYPSEMTEEDLKKEFTNNIREWKVVKVNKIHDIADYFVIVQKIRKIQKQLKFHQLSQSDKNCLKLKVRLEKLIQQKNEIFQEFSESILHHKHRHKYSQCFVTMEDKLSVTEIMDNYQNNKEEKLRSRYLNEFGIKQSFEPTDIIWENYGQTKRQKIWGRVRTLIATVFVMFIIYGGIWLLKYYQINYYEGTYQFLVISLAISLIISIFNIVLRFLLRKLVILEKRTTYTRQEDSVVRRIGLSYFITNALVVLIVYKTTTGEWVLWKQRGVIFTTTIVMILSIFFDGLYDLVHPEYLLQIMRRFLLQKKIQKGKIVFQEDANKAFEGYEFDIAERYFQLIKVLSVCLFYQPVLPYGLLIGLIEIFVTYWTQKYTLYNYVNKPRQLSFEFSIRQINNVNFSTFAMFAGYVFFEILILQKFTNFCLVLIILGVIQIFFDEEDLIYFLGDKKLRFIDYVKQNEQTFTQCELTFPYDYDRENPITQKEAYFRFVKKILQKQKFNLKIQQPSLNQQTELEQSLFNYVSRNSKRLNIGFLPNQHIHHNSSLNPILLQSQLENLQRKQAYRKTIHKNSQPNQNDLEYLDSIQEQQEEQSMQEQMLDEQERVLRQLLQSKSYYDGRQRRSTRDQLLGESNKLLQNEYFSQNLESQKRLFKKQDFQNTSRDSYKIGSLNSFEQNSQDDTLNQILNQYFQ